MELHQRTVNIAEAKKRFSEILGKVVFGKETIVVTKRGKPMVEIIPFQKKRKHPGDMKGFLNNDDSFFEDIETFRKQFPRMMRKKRKNVSS
jgi:prevent-host-death family protein